MQDDNESMPLGAKEAYFEAVEGESAYELKLEETLKTTMAGLIENRFEESKDARDHDEARWLTAYHNFRGIYGKNVKFRDAEKSRVFVKVTKTKVLAAYGQLIDVIFGTGDFPIGVSETKIPEGIETYKHLSASPTDIETSVPEVSETPEPEETVNPFDVGYEGDGKVLKAGATFGKGSVLEEAIKENSEAFQAGAHPDPNVSEIQPAKEAARKMQKLIHDQIEESSGASELRSAIFESALFGTGIVKGPFNFNKTIGRWKTEAGGERRTYEPISVRVPRIEFVSIWDFYPDPNATCMEECEYVVHRHKMNKSQLRALAKAPYFDKEKIRECLALGPNYVEEDFEHSLKDDQRNEEGSTKRFEVLEYWGIMDAEYAREVGMELPESVDDLDEVQINSWVCNGQLLRSVINPFTPHRLPYNAFCYEKNPYSFFGIGVAENMDDSQQIMNGHARMAIDNLALSGNLVFDVDETALVNGQSMEIYAGKIFRRQAGMQGQAIHGIKFPNTSQENMMMFDKFRQLADEQTGIPSYSHGQTGVQSMTRTASGMSMLLGAASLNIKTVVKNLDDFLLKPLGEAYFQWNMQFFEGPLDIQGDLEVRALGTNSLMQKEVRSQRLTTFLQTAQNPTIAPFVKISKIVSELAYSLDLDPDEILNDPEEAKIIAQIIGAQNAGQAVSGPTQGVDPQQLAMGGAGGLPTDSAQPSGTGAEGGGVVPANVSFPSEASFSG